MEAVLWGEWSAGGTAKDDNEEEVDDAYGAVEEEEDEEDGEGYVGGWEDSDEDDDGPRARGYDYEVRLSPPFSPSTTPHGVSSRVPSLRTTGRFGGWQGDGEGWEDLDDDDLDGGLGGLLGDEGSDVIEVLLIVSPSMTHLKSTTHPCTSR